MSRQDEPSLLMMDIKFFTGVCSLQNALLEMGGREGWAPHTCSQWQIHSTMQWQGAKECSVEK